MKEKNEITNYIFFGIITTFVNIVCYTFLTKLLAFDFKTATTLAWLLSVSFAFITNKRYVFKSREKEFLILCKEFGTFLLSRMISYGLDIISMIFLVEIMGFDDLVSKMTANVLVIIFNYLASKLIVFRPLAGSDK
ncbi:MAG: GtrA family protein [Peptococcaceae bacterium]|nr:GtrA family protein [Peptococcaceae bacterium]